jgi:hypothetical protein
MSEGKTKRRKVVKEGDEGERQREKLRYKM